MTPPPPPASGPEAEARVEIDAALAAAGWAVQNRSEMNLSAKRGVAVREFKLRSGHGFADYLLFVDGQPFLYLSTGAVTKFTNLFPCVTPAVRFECRVSPEQRRHAGAGLGHPPPPHRLLVMSYENGIHSCCGQKALGKATDKRKVQPEGQLPSRLRALVTLRYARSYGPCRRDDIDDVTRRASSLQNLVE